MPSTPPPLPPPLPRPGEPRPAAPLPYAAPGATPPARRGSLEVFHVGTVLWSGTMVLVWLGILLYVLPRLQEVLTDFRVELPAATRLLLLVARAAAAGGWVLLLLIPVALGFTAGALGPGGRRALRMVATLVFGLLVAATVLAVMQPVLTLMTGMGAAGGKR